MSWLFYVLIVAIVIESIVVFCDINYTKYDSDKGAASFGTGAFLLIVCVVCMCIRANTVPDEHEMLRYMNWKVDMSFVNKSNVQVKYEVAQESIMFSRKMTFVLCPNETRYFNRCTAGGYRLINECAVNNVESEYERLVKGRN